jgi:hypothetical protein
MDSRLVFFLLGAVSVAALGASGRDCPTGFRCAGIPVAGQACRIEEGPYRGESGTLVDGRCLRSSEGGSALSHTHVIEAGHCPLCGGAGEEFLSFNVQGGRPGQMAPRRLLRCTTCSNLFADLP